MRVALAPGSAAEDGRGAGGRGGNSGFQIAEELAAIRSVELSIATTYPMLPQRRAGRDLFWWLTLLGLMRVTVDSRLGRRASRREFIIGTNRRQLERAGVRFRPRLVDAEGHTVRFADHRLLEDVGVVVWATGYRSDNDWIHLPGWCGKAMLCTGGV